MGLAVALLVVLRDAGWGLGAVFWVVVAVVGPLTLLTVLRLRPALDVVWDNNPAHFWLVLGAAAVALTLGHSLTEAARRRHDARLLLVSLALIAGAGFLGLHALATPGVLVGPNAGFELATPIGLVVGSLFAAVSGLELTPEAGRRIMTRSRLMLAVLLGFMLVWAIASVAELPPLDTPVADESLPAWQIGFVVIGVVGYGIGTWGYVRPYRRRGAPIVLAFAVAFALLAVTLLVVAFAVNWRVSWWEWHVVMLVAFVVVAVAARREWYEERFSALYLEQTLQGTTEASILFADLESFTPYSERTEPGEVRRMLDGYFSRLIPLMREHGGNVHQLIGDAVMVVFNKDGNQPDHPRLAARAALAFQEAAAELAAANPDWPRFLVGQMGPGSLTDQHATNRGLGLEPGREVDGVADDIVLAVPTIADDTRGDLAAIDPDTAVVEQLPPMRIKGKAEPVTAYLLHHLAS